MAAPTSALKYKALANARPAHRHAMTYALIHITAKIGGIAFGEQPLEIEVALLCTVAGDAALRFWRHHMSMQA